MPEIIIMEIIINQLNCDSQQNLSGGGVAMPVSSSMAAMAMAMGSGDLLLPFAAAVEAFAPGDAGSGACDWAFAPAVAGLCA